MHAECMNTINKPKESLTQCFFVTTWFIMGAIIILSFAELFEKPLFVHNLTLEFNDIKRYKQV